MARPLKIARFQGTPGAPARSRRAAVCGRAPSAAVWLRLRAKALRAEDRPRSGLVAAAPRCAFRGFSHLNNREILKTGVPGCVYQAAINGARVAFSPNRVRVKSSCHRNHTPVMGTLAVIIQLRE